MNSIIFEENKYSRWYYSIIKNCINREKSDLYTEKHHVIPKSLGGSNDKQNLVRLFPREHFLVHWLLIKMCKSKDHTIKMKYALTRMMKNNDITYAHKWSKWQYELSSKIRPQIMYDLASIGKSPRLGKKHTEEAKEKMRLKKLGVKRNPELIGYLKVRKHSSETKNKISESLKGRVFSEESKEKSRLAQKGRPAEKVSCPHCNKIGGKPIMMRYHFNNCKNKSF